MSAATTNTFKLRWYVSVAFVLFIFVIVGIYSSQMAQNTSTYDDEQALARTKKLHDMQATDAKTLTTADWIDKDKGVVRIPVEEAMTQEIPVLQAKPVVAGSEIPSAAPAAAPAPAAGTPPAPANPPPKP